MAGTPVSPQRPTTRTRLRRAWLRLAGGRNTPLPLDSHPPLLPPGAEVLLVRPDHLGDVLFVGPALRRLRTKLPEAHLTLLVGPWSLEIARRLPELDQVRTLEFPWFDRRGARAPWSPYVQLVSEAKRLRPSPDRQYDAAIILRDDDYWSAMLTARAGIAVRAGHDDEGVRPFLTHVLGATLRPEHTAAADLILAAAFVGDVPAQVSGGSDPLQLTLTDTDQARARALLAEARAPSRGPVAVHPGSGADVKRWRPSAWARVLHGITGEGETVVVTGGPDEAPLARAVAAFVNRPILDLTGRTGLGELAAVFARCRLVLGPDSGPLHLAVAVGVPTVHLFGPASQRRFGPWGPPGKHMVVSTALPCAPCGRLNWPEPAEHPCVRTISPEAVLEAARSCERPAANL